MLAHYTVISEIRVSPVSPVSYILFTTLSLYITCLFPVSTCLREREEREREREREREGGRERLHSDDCARAASTSLPTTTHTHTHHQCRRNHARDRALLALLCLVTIKHLVDGPWITMIRSVRPYIQTARPYIQM